MRAMRHGQASGGALTRGPARAPAWALLPAAVPVLTCLLLSRPDLSVFAAGIGSLGLLAACGPTAGSLCLVPLSLLGAALVGGPITALAGVATVTMTLLLRRVSGAALRAPHAWIALLGLLLLLSFVFPSVSLSTPVEWVDLVGLLGGLVLLAVVTAAPPPPGAVARVTAAAGGLAGAYVLAVGEHAAGRLQGLGLNPNYLGALLVLPFVAAVGVTRLTRQPAWLVPAAVCLAAMAGTQSRGAFLASVVGVGAVLVQGRPRHVQLAIVAAVTAAGAVLPSGLGAAEHLVAGHRPETQLSLNTSVREHAAGLAAQVAAEHPFRGIGYGMFPPYAQKSSRLGIYIATHDDYLRLAAEAGVFTLATFLVLLWLGLGRRRSGEAAVARAIVLAYAVGLFFANQLASLLISIPFWLSLGCLLAARRPPVGHIRSAREEQSQ
jgi:hypothetical protein